jgi:hypothetical protein
MTLSDLTDLDYLEETRRVFALVAVRIRGGQSISRGGAVYTIVETTAVVQELTKKNLGSGGGREELSGLVRSSYHDRIGEFREYLLYRCIELNLALLN